ncbi:MAG: hypothetical protein M4579_004355 [Chaenotheca gracillima]|nr:MAG: hypothetical protein M4579_004355 [Chaenotheca gracillima]
MSWSYSSPYYVSSPSMGEPMSATTSSAASSSNFSMSKSMSTSSSYSYATESSTADFSMENYMYVENSNGEEYWLLKPEFAAGEGLPKTILLANPHPYKANALVCLFPNCGYDCHSTRRADMIRHYKTCHFILGRFDCTARNCDRVGENGFSREDHRTEHLRDYHKRDIVKKRGGRAVSSDKGNRR